MEEFSNSWISHKIAIPLKHKIQVPTYCGISCFIALFIKLASNLRLMRFLYSGHTFSKARPYAAYTTSIRQETWEQMGSFIDLCYIESQESQREKPAANP